MLSYMTEQTTKQSEEKENWKIELSSRGPTLHLAASDANSKYK